MKGGLGFYNDTVRFETNISNYEEGYCHLTTYQCYVDKSLQKMNPCH